MHCDASSRPLHVPGAVSPAHIRPARPHEWEQARRLRLEMLADTPHSFGDRLEDAVDWDNERWRIRHESHLLPDSAVLVAVGATGGWVGHMAVREFHNYSQPRAWLLGVYVTPAHRGDGTAGALLDAVESWALDRGFDALYLDVHERAIPAQRFYDRQGFRRTGASHPCPLDTAATEFEMMKHLTSEPPLPLHPGRGT